MTKYMESTIENLPEILEYNGFKKIGSKIYDNAFTRDVLRIQWHNDGWAIFCTIKDSQILIITKIEEYRRHIILFACHDFKLDLKLPPIEPTTFEEWWEINKKEGFIFHMVNDKEIYPLSNYKLQVEFLMSPQGQTFNLGKNLSLEKKIKLAQTFMEIYSND